jgi:hypothetical protein
MNENLKKKETKKNNKETNKKKRALDPPCEGDWFLWRCFMAVWLAGCQGSCTTTFCTPEKRVIISAILRLKTKNFQKQNRRLLSRFTKH